MRQQGGECHLLRGFPYPGKILTSEGSEGGDNIRESRDEFSVKVTETKESTDSFDRFRWRPGHNGR